MEIVIQLAVLVVGFILLIKGADWFVEGASSIADRFGIPQLVIGLTIVAMGTSAPEAAVSISAALKGSAEITIGNILGSNNLNVLLILGLTSVIRAVPVQKSTISYEMPFLIGITAIFSVLGLQDNTISRLEGGILWALMIVYLIYLLQMAKKGRQETAELEAAEAKQPIWKLLCLLLFGIICIVVGSDMTVDAATKLAKIFGMTERFIGLTIVAFGTSLPELVTSATAALKGKSDIAVGNIVGSNLFNILFVVGTVALITPVTYNADFLVDSIVALSSVVLLLICLLPKKQLNRIGGSSLLLGYIVYFMYLLLS